MPDWFQPPPGIKRVTLCRASGELATDACRAAAERPDDTYALNDSTTDLPSTSVQPPVPAGVYDEYVAIGSVRPCELHGGSADPRIAAAADVTHSAIVARTNPARP